MDDWGDERSRGARSLRSPAPAPPTDQPAADPGHRGSLGRDHEAAPAVRRRREAGAPQDQAMYTCECGFVFRAQVSTSVGCPHCGGFQAW